MEDYATNRVPNNSSSQYYIPFWATYLKGRVIKGVIGIAKVH